MVDVKLNERRREETHPVASVEIGEKLLLIASNNDAGRNKLDSAKSNYAKNKDAHIFLIETYERNTKGLTLENVEKMIKGLQSMVNYVKGDEE